MAIRYKWLLAAAVAASALAWAPVARADNTAPLCSQVEYRTEYLRECNMQDSPIFFGGQPDGDRQGCSDICGIVDGVLGSIGLGGILG